MTEDEAKTKWCPAFRGNDHGINRPLDLDTNALMGRCIGSACMAWRWSNGPHAGRARDVSVIGRPGGWIGLADVRRHEQHNEQYPGEWEIERDPPMGYCGLAGTLT